MTALKICPSMAEFEALKSDYEGHSHSGYAAKSEAIKSITRSGTTFTATRCDGTTFTFSQQDNNTLPGVTCGQVAKTLNVTSSWNNHFFGTTNIAFANQGTTSYYLFLTAYSGGSIPGLTVKTKYNASADIFVELPFSLTNYSVTIQYLIVK